MREAAQPSPRATEARAVLARKGSGLRRRTRGTPDRQNSGGGLNGKETLLIDQVRGGTAAGRLACCRCRLPVLPPPGPGAHGFLPPLPAPRLAARRRRCRRMLATSLRSCRLATHPAPCRQLAANHRPRVVRPALAPQPPASKYRSFRTRFISSIVLIASFLTIIWAGHVPLMFMVLGIQARGGLAFGGWLFGGRRIVCVCVTCVCECVCVCVVLLYPRIAWILGEVGCWLVRRCSGRWRTCGSGGAGVPCRGLAAAPTQALATHSPHTSPPPARCSPQTCAPPPPRPAADHDGEGALHAGAPRPGRAQAARLPCPAVVLLLRGRLLELRQVGLGGRRQACMCMRAAWAWALCAGLRVRARESGGGRPQVRVRVRAVQQPLVFGWPGPASPPEPPSPRPAPRPTPHTLHHHTHTHAPPRRFIKNNLVVEITSSARLARMFGWLLKRHTIVSFYLYCAGFVRCGRAAPWQQLWRGGEAAGAGAGAIGCLVSVPVSRRGAFTLPPPCPSGAASC